MVPSGPLFGLRACYFLHGGNQLPSAITVKAAASPVRTIHQVFPFQIEAGAERISIPFEIGPITPALGAVASITVSDPEALLAPYDFPQSASVFAGRASLHALFGWGEVFTTVRYKQEGYLPNETPYEDRSLWLGTRLLWDL